MLFSCGWAIIEADEQAIGLLPAAAWQAGLDEDGAVQEDKHVAEITHLLSRAAGWPAGLRWIVRRTKPSRRHVKNLTAFERATGWRCSITVTNVPAAGGISGVPGSHHPQFIGVLHREHAVVEDRVSTNKAMGLGIFRRRPGRSTAAGCWPPTSRPTCPPGACSRPIRPGGPQRRRGGHAALPALQPARPAGPPRPRPRRRRSAGPGPGKAPSYLLAAAIRPACTRLTSHPVPATRKKEATPAQSEPVPPRAHRAAPPPAGNTRTRHNGRKPAQHDQQLTSPYP